MMNHRTSSQSPPGLETRKFKEFCVLQPGAFLIVISLKDQGVVLGLIYRPGMCRPCRVSQSWPCSLVSTGELGIMGLKSHVPGVTGVTLKTLVMRLSRTLKADLRRQSDLTLVRRTHS